MIPRSIFNQGLERPGPDVSPTFKILLQNAIEGYWAVLSCGAVYCAVQSGSDICRLWIKSTEQFFFVVLLVMLYKVVPL